MVVSRPTTLFELHRFYAEEFTPLYNRFQNLGRVPQEISAEIAAAADHLLFLAPVEGAEPFSPEMIGLAAGHLKRATFDGFKMLFEEEIRAPRDRFMDDHYAEVNDGTFRQKVAELWGRARAISAEARALERKSRSADLSAWDAAFGKWRELIPIADAFAALETDPTVVRATGRSKRQRLIAFVRDIVVGALAGVAAFFLLRAFGIS